MRIVIGCHYLDADRPPALSASVDALTDNIAVDANLFVSVLIGSCLDGMARFAQGAQVSI